jgi:O-antigen ligase
MNTSTAHDEINYGIHLGILDVLVFCLFIPAIRVIPKDGVLVIAFFSMLVSGVITQGIFAHPLTYLLYITTFSFVATFAYQDANREKSGDFKLGIIPLFLAVCFFVGLLLVQFGGIQWGSLPMEFSRKSRGQVVFWRLVDLHFLLPCVAVLMLYTRRKLRFFMTILAFVTLFILVSTYTRTWAIQCTLPWVLYFVYRLKSFETRVFVMSVVGLVIFGLYADALYNWLMVSSSGGTADLEKSLTGRLQLWSVYWNLFINNPIFGYGQYNLVQRGLISREGAFSEVGILVWFTNFGLIFALPMMWILINAAIRGIRNIILSKGDLTPLDLFCSIAFLTYLPSMILQEASRILYVSDFVVYFSMFYLYYVSRTASHSLEPGEEYA